MKRLMIFILGLMLVCMGCEQEEALYQYNIPELDSDGWTITSLEDVGFQVNKLEGLIELLMTRNDHYVHSIAMAKNGKLVFEHYFTLYNTEGEDLNYDREKLHFQASVSKSFTSTLLGIAIDEGLFPNVETRLIDLYPEYHHLLSGNKALITVEHILSMTAGLSWIDDPPFNEPGNDGYHILYDEDPVGYVLSQELISIPGSTFNYSTGNTVIIEDLLERELGIPLEDYAVVNLFEPMEFNDYRWKVHPSGAAISTGSLFINSRDMLKLGQLYLDRGLWNGTQLVSSDWIDKALSKTIELPYRFLGDASDGYGYQWWLVKYHEGELDAFLAAGWGGQFIIGIPDLDLVVAITSGAYSGNNPFNIHEMIIEDYVLPALGF